MHLLRYIIICDISPVVDRILPHLMASEVASLLCAINAMNKFRHAKKYLNPLRDIDPSMSYFDNMMLQGHEILVLGDGVEVIMQRLLAPEKYWASRRWEENECRSLWILAIPSDATELLNEADSLLMASVSSSESSYEFTDLVARRLLKQIWVSDRYGMEIGYMGDEEDWSADWHCATQSSVAWRKPLGVTTEVMIPNTISDYQAHDISINGISFHMRWDDVYFRHLKEHKWGNFRYIHINKDPLKVLRTTFVSSPSSIPEFYIMLTNGCGREAYLKIR